MDAPAMFTRKHVPEDAGLRNIVEDEGAGGGGQGQLHRHEKQHKPVLKKVKEKVKKIKNTLVHHGHGHGHGHDGDERGGDGSTGSEEGEEDALEREAALEKGGYMDDVEDKPLAVEPDPEVHGAPMYESARAPAVQDPVTRMPAVHDPLARMPAVHDHAATYEPTTTRMPAVHDPVARMPAVHDPVARMPAWHDPLARMPAGHDPLASMPAVHDPVTRMPAVQYPVARYEPARIPAVQEVEGDDAPRVRLGDLAGPVVEDPAAPRSTTRAAREGEDIGTTPVVQAFESMTVSDDPPHVGAAKKGARAEEWKDEAAEKMGAASGGGASYTDKLKNTAAGTAEYGKKLATTVYEKVAGGGGAASHHPEREEERKGATPVSGSSASTDTTGGASGGGAAYTERLKNTAAGTAELGKKMATTVYEKVAGGRGGAASDHPKRDDERKEAMPVSDAGGEEWKDASEATGATDGASGGGYTDKIKSAAAGTTEYGKQIATTVYETVAGVGSAVAPSLRPQVGAGERDVGRNDATPVSESDTGREEFTDAAAGTHATDTASGAGYTDKIKSAAAGTTQYGKQLATTVYDKVVDAGTTVVGKVQEATHSGGTATPGVGTQQQEDSGATAAPGAGGTQDKGVTVTGYIADMLRPGEEDRALSEAISGAVQRRKEDVGGTVAQRVPAPGQVITKAREAVTSLTGGGNRVSKAVAVKPTTTGGREAKEGVAVVAVEKPVLGGEENRGAKLNTNTM
ncbi:hypothetical protein ACP70R_019464 [Stipagrostis hirtigluma subsp. patula]